MADEKHPALRGVEERERVTREQVDAYYKPRMRRTGPRPPRPRLTRPRSGRRPTSLSRTDLRPRPRPWTVF
jgi:hypothetical protein